MAWVAFWFWAFSFAFSDSFFAYHRHTRIPLFVGAVLCASLLPLSAWLQWRSVADGSRSAVRALAWHMAASVVALCLPLALTFLFSRAEGPWRLEADEAMGAGINNAVLLLLAVSTALILAVAMGARALRRARH
jgi:hypothetical protein